MTKSLVSAMREDMDCEELFSFFHDINDLDRCNFRLLYQSDEPMTVDELAEEVDRERSTVYQSTQRLLQAGLIQKHQRNYEEGGYYHVYDSRNPERIAADLQETLNDHYQAIQNLIREFEERYVD